MLEESLVGILQLIACSNFCVFPLERQAVKMFYDDLSNENDTMIIYQFPKYILFYLFKQFEIKQYYFKEL